MLNPVAQIKRTPFYRQRAEAYKARHGTYPEWWTQTGKIVTRSGRGPTAPEVDWEQTLYDQILHAGLPAPVQQFRWCRPRMFRADMAYPERRILIEVQGGIWKEGDDGKTGGGHNRPAGYTVDLDKYNLAQEIGWRVFQFVPERIKSGEALDLITRLLETKREE